MKQILFFLGALILNFNAVAWNFSDFKSELASPLTTKATPVLYIGGGLTLATVLLKKQVVDPVQNNVSVKKPLGHWSTYGDYAGRLIPNAAYFIGQSIAGYYGNDKGYRRALGMFKATAYSGLVTTVLKYTIREGRPGNPQERNSFPSGHSTTIFAFSGYILAEHGWQWGVPALMLSGFTAFSRINDNRHYLHDVLAGSTIGLAYGLAIAMQDEEKAKTGKSSSVSYAPLLSEGIYGAMALYSF